MFRYKLTFAFAGTLLLCSAPIGRSDAPRKIEITARRFSFTPNEITLKKGETVVLVFHSEDVTHGFKLPEMHAQQSDIKKGNETEVTLTPQQSGQFVGKCAHFCGKGHGSMALQINVVD